MTTPRRSQSREHPRRRELVAAAARLFSEKGFQGTSMEDIADALGILKGSLYYWISTKEELLEEVLLGTLEGGIEEGNRIVSQELPARDRLRQLVQSHVGGWVRNPYHYSAFASEYKWLSADSLARYRLENRRLESLFSQVIFDGISSGEFRLPREHVAIVVKLLMSQLNTFSRWYSPDGWAAPVQVAEILVNQVIYGLHGLREDL